MQISSISFKGDSRNNRTNNRRNNSLERQPSQDRLEKNSPQRRSRRRRKTPPIVKIGYTTVGIAAAMVINFFSGALAKTPQSITVPYENNVSFQELAQTYDSDVDAILEYNDITEYTNLDELEEITIPASFDYLEEEIAKLQESLFDKNLDEERSLTESKIQELQLAQELQHDLAIMYTDGKYVYIQLREVDENTPENIKKQLERGINVEIFKEIFGIEDKAIRRYNNISSTWRPNENPEIEGGYFDYTGGRVDAGETIKVPVKSLSIENITFNISLP